MAGWKRYFASQNSYFSSTEGLQDQLRELEDTVFARDKSIFDVIDIQTGTFNNTRVHDEEELNLALDHAPASGTRIISISSSRTISPLRITSHLAAILLDRCDVKKDFLRVLLSFGDQPHESEASSGNHTFIPLDNQESVLLYKLNYVEQNRRSSQDQWSFRHVGVYHHHKQNSDLFILLHCQPTSMLSVKLEQLIDDASTGVSAQAIRERLCANPGSLHSLTLSCYLDNWRPYLRYLGKQFSRINDQAMIMSGSVTTTAEEDNFRKVQSLRNTNDFALFSSACCSSNREIIECMSHSGPFSGEQIRELRSMENMLRGYIESSTALRQRIINTVELAGYTLSLHNQRDMRQLTQEIQSNAKETGLVTLRLQKLTENTVDDGAVVRIITIISAIYLPGSFVATIFGTNFFKFDEQVGKISITNDFWVFLSVWLGLTCITLSMIFVYISVQKKRKIEARG